MTNKHAQILGRIGGKKSVKVRFEGKTKEQKSELMRKVRLNKNFASSTLTPECRAQLIQWLKDVGQITN